MEEVWIQIGVQVPGILVVGFSLSYVFLRVFSLVLDKQGRQIEKMATSLDRMSDSLERILTVLALQGK